MMHPTLFHLLTLLLVSACCRGPKHFDDPAGHYSVSVPGSPTAGFINQDAGDSRFLSVFTYETSSGGVHYVFGRGSVEGDSEDLTAQDLEKITIACLEAEHHATLDSDEKVTVDGHFRAPDMRDDGQR